MSLLTEDQLEQTWAAWHADHSADALELLVLEYEGLAQYHARRAAARAPAHQDREEIASWARIGLLDAIRKFAPDGGASFQTYAATRIPGAIKDGQRGQDPLTRSMRHQVKLVESAIDVLWDRYHREPTTDDLANETGLDADVVRTTLMMRKSINGSLEDSGVEESHSVLHEGEVQVRMHEVRTHVAAKIADLSPRCQAFFLLHYTESLNMTQTCQKMQIGADWARQTRHLTIAGLTS